MKYGLTKLTLLNFHFSVVEYFGVQTYIYIICQELIIIRYISGF